MVGIVVVSHSRALARASVALAADMLHGRAVRVAVAAGLDEATFGTDAVRVKEAIEEVDEPDGVLVDGPRQCRSVGGDGARPARTSGGWPGAAVFGATG